MHHDGSNAGEIQPMDLNAMRDVPNEKISTAWKKSRGPTKADRYSLEAARAINSLLISPIAVLPEHEGSYILPFNVGISAKIKRLLRPDASRSELRRALRRYTHSASYLYASAQPDARRHDISGAPGELLSENDRVNARQMFLMVQQKKQERWQNRERLNKVDIV